MIKETQDYTRNAIDNYKKLGIVPKIEYKMEFVEGEKVWLEGSGYSFDGCEVIFENCNLSSNAVWFTRYSVIHITDIKNIHKLSDKYLVEINVTTRFKVGDIVLFTGNDKQLKGQKVEIKEIIEHIETVYKVENTTISKYSRYVHGSDLSKIDNTPKESVIAYLRDGCFVSNERKIIIEDYDSSTAKYYVEMIDIMTGMRSNQWISGEYIVGLSPSDNKELKGNITIKGILSEELYFPNIPEESFEKINFTNLSARRDNFVNLKI